jgi:hypothetical protein
LGVSWLAGCSRVCGGERRRDVAEPGFSVPHHVEAPSAKSAGARLSRLLCVTGEHDGLQWRAEFGHPQMGTDLCGSQRPHCDEFLVGGGEGGLDRGDLTEPALVLGFLESVDEVGADLVQSPHLGWVNREQRASDTGVFVRAGGSEVAAAARRPSNRSTRSRSGAEAGSTPVFFSSA